MNYINLDQPSIDLMDPEGSAQDIRIDALYEKRYQLEYGTSPDVGQEITAVENEIDSILNGPTHVLESSGVLIFPVIFDTLPAQLQIDERKETGVVVLNQMSEVLYDFAERAGSGLMKTMFFGKSAGFSNIKSLKNGFSFTDRYGNPRTLTYVGRYVYSLNAEGTLQRFLDTKDVTYTDFKILHALGIY